ncbi:hypothetical protein E4T47_07079 [Aureobasidium subglaciale]|nr:hypothetical protein E4T43_07141 [Aureobasidium subglaciale]KAI5269476.1 hypothetical protein E4T47_07079 [Aureobasidium subglaciale]
MYGEGQITYRSIISIFQIFTFSTSLTISYYFRRTNRLGYLCLVLFSIVRLISASCFLALINHDTYGLKATVFICEGLGIILFVFIFVEILGWVDEQASVLHRYALLVPQVLTYVDLLIAIVGFIVIRKRENAYEPTAFSKASRALLVLMYAYTIMLLGILVHHRNRSARAKAQRNALMGVGACIPFMVIRLVYSLIFEATGNMRFNAVKGDETTYLSMTFLPEALVVFVCIATIWKIPLGVKNKNGSEEGQGVNDEERMLSRAG